MTIEYRWAEGRYDRYPELVASYLRERSCLSPSSLFLTILLPLQTFNLCWLAGNSDVRADKIITAGTPRTVAAFVSPANAGVVKIAVIVEVFFNFFSRGRCNLLGCLLS